MTADAKPADLKLGGGARTLMLAGLVVGAAATGGAILVAGWESFLRSWLTSFAFFLSISLGALFFVLIQHLTRSGWSVTVRRIAEVLAGNVLLLAFLFIPIILGIDKLYEWTHGEGDPLLEHKAGWLSREFFVVRIGVYFGIWILISRFLHRTSVRQDESGDPDLTLKMQKWSAPALVLYAVTVTLASIDLLMSLDPHWFSTIYGVYYFAGGLLAFFAFIIPTVFLLQRSGKMDSAINVEHYHDLGKQLFGYVVFWGYIAYSQMMLIRYANIPEETRWYLLRTEGGWGVVSDILFYGHFLVPFLLLLPREVKRKPALLAGIAVYLLVMHWVDLFWLTAPSAHHPGVPFGAADVLAFVGLLGLFTAMTLFRLSSAALVPERDPRLPESLAFENV